MERIATISMTFVRAGLLLAVAGCVFLGCTATKELLALRQVDFRFDGISGARVAGIPLRGIHSYADLSAGDVARIGIAIARSDVPLDLTLHVEGLNPESNEVTARMVAMGWEYLIDDREVVSGRLSQAIAFPPGEPRDVPLPVSVNLVDLFGGRGRDLVEVALALAGQPSTKHQVTLRLTPSVETSAGRIRYPIPIDLDVSSREPR